MNSTITENQKNVAAAMHLSTFAKYFFPFGNFIAPLLLWTFNKEKTFVDNHGKQAINFQLSTFLYTILIGMISLPFVLIFASDFISLIDTIDHTINVVTLREIKSVSASIIVILIAIMLFIGLFVFELYAVISATMAASKGQLYKYPLSISFIKTTSQPQVIETE
ncbi:MAG: hypothetical protein COB12_12100 [Flavobacterium sp.]|nr:MAG: hypothetical protein COB12_12100 [Flavobacterium sp.]